jgi:HAD superfamily hydrolase (TIGR01490 family)
MPAADDEIPPSSQAPGVARVTGEASAQATSTALPTGAAEVAGAAVPELEAALAPPPDPTVGAFFDVDNTVMRGASIFHLARGLYKRDFFSLRDIVGFAWQQLSFLARGENLEHIDQIQAKALGFIAGHSVAELRAVGEEVFDEIMATKIWPGTKALAQMHLDAGQRVWLVTATPVEVAEVIARRLGLTGGLGTVAEHVDGIYTGHLVGSLLHGPAKVEAVRALAGREGLDLERCSAYSDSANDIPLLSLVGNPCAINPDRKLRGYAKAHGWRVRDYRTGRKAARVGIPVAAVAGALVGAVMGAAAANRRFRHAKQEGVRRRPSGAARAGRRGSAGWSAVPGR